MAARLSPADAVWYLGETEQNPMVISTVLWLDGPLDVGLLRQRVAERVLERHPVFRSRIVPSRIPGRLPRWEDDDPDLDVHIRIVDLPPPGDHALLEARCSLERSTPLVRDRPLWTSTVYRGYRGDGTAIHTRVHHSLGDGIAFMRLFLTLCDEYSPDDIALREPPTLAERAHDLGRRAATLASDLLPPTRLLAEVGSAARWTARIVLPDLVQPNILHGVPHGTKRMSWDPEGAPVERLKDVGAQVGATVNEVLLTIVTGALHRYLVERDALVDEVLVMVPVALRDPSAPLPRHLGNRIGVVPVHLPVGATEPAERLAQVQAQMEELKGSPAPAISYLALAFSSLTTPPIGRSLHRINQLRSTGVLTNVPGPSEQLHLGGVRVLGTVGWGGLTGDLNLSGSFISLGGRVFPGLVTDTAITDDPDRLLDHVRAEWSAATAALAAPHG